MILNKKQKGETLIEVITALTALVLAGVASVTVIISVMHSNAISKEYLIAQNLAREGIEGVISIRNTNWLKYPSDKENKWLCISPQADNCISVETGKGYALKRDINSLNAGFDLVDRSPIKLTDITFDDRFKLGLSISGDLELYNAYNFGGSEPTIPTFYRMITFEKIETSTLVNKYKVTVRIQWLNRSQVNKYELTSIITNYAK